MNIQITLAILYIIGFLIAFYCVTRAGDELWVVVLTSLAWPITTALILMAALFLGIWCLFEWMYKTIKGAV